jgi:hypothetical protein
MKDAEKKRKPEKRKRLTDTYLSAARHRCPGPLALGPKLHRVGEKSGGEKQKAGAEGRRGVNPGWELVVEELAWLNSRIEGLDGLEVE